MLCLPLSTNWKACVVVCQNMNRRHAGGGGGGGCNWQTTDVTSVKFLCPVAEGMREWGMLNFQTYDALQHQSKDFSEFILVIQQSISSHSNSATCHAVTRHSLPLSLSLSRLLSTSLSLWTIFKYQLWQLIDAFCNYFWRSLRGWDWKIVSCIDDTSCRKKILVQNVWKTYTYIYAYI